MTILWSAPRRRKLCRYKVDLVWARIEEKLTEPLLHGASAYEEDEFSEIDLDLIMFRPAERTPFNRKQVSKKRKNFFDWIVS